MCCSHLLDWRPYGDWNPPLVDTMERNVKCGPCTQRRGKLYTMGSRFRHAAYMWILVWTPFSVIAYLGCSWMTWQWNQSTICDSMLLCSFIPTPCNPLVPEFKISAKPINAGDKWCRPGENHYHCVLRFIVISYSWNGFSKDFLTYVCDPEGFLVALVICCCVTAMEATMETARSVEKD